MSFSVSDQDEIDFIMSVQHQLINHDDRNKQGDRWNSSPKQRAIGRWMSESSLCLNEPPRRPRKNHREPGRWESDSNLSRTKSHAQPPRRPKKSDVGPMSTEESRWKDCLPVVTSSFALVRPTRRESLGLTIKEINEKMASMNCQLAVPSNHSEGPVTRAAMTA